MTETKALVRIDPQFLLQKAVEGNASIETLERLVALAKDVREVQAREAWHEAMAEFQRRCPPIKKTNTAQIVTAKGYYSYKYAALDEIMEMIRPLLGELGLSVSWSSRVEPQRVVVACRIAHALGYSESSGEISMPVPDSADRGGGNPAQRVGSALTYARRYSLLQVTGLAPEDDDDAQAIGKHEKSAQPESPAGVTGGPESTGPVPGGGDGPAPPAGDVSPEERHALAVEDWKLELAGAESVEKLAAIWKTLEKPTVWSNFKGSEQVALRREHDKRKSHLVTVHPQGNSL